MLIPLFVYTINGDKMKVLITGASGGIGYKLGVCLAKRNHFVYMTTHTKSQERELIKKIVSLKMNNNIKVFKLDITNKTDLTKIDRLDIDVLFVHAGIGEGGSILEIPIEKLKYNFEVNIFSNIDLIRKYLKTRIENNKKGKVIVTSSMASVIPIPYLGSYTSSKSALSMLIKTLNKELRISGSKIKIYLIEPGAYKTGFNQVMINKINGYDEVNKQLRMHKLFNLVECRNISAVVNKMVYLAQHNSIRFIHRVPLLQRILIRLYIIFFG